MNFRPVDFGRLGPMALIDGGATGLVYRLESFTLPGFTGLAYKQFLVTPSHAKVTNLIGLIALRHHLASAQRDALDAQTAWPLRLVTEQNLICGFLMPPIPPAFFGTQVLPSGRTVRLPTKTQWLVIDPDRADAAGIVAPAADDVPTRLVLCAKLAHVMGLLHRTGCVYGDLSLSNVIYTTGALPQIMLIGCDSVQSPSAPPVAQDHTDDWIPPEAAGGERRQTVEGDLYKLALFILRTLTPGPHASQSMDPNRMIGVLDLAGNTMMRAGLSREPQARPTAKQWFDYLTGYARQLTSPPQFLQAETDAVAAVNGAMVAVSWRVTGAKRVSITDVNGRCFTGNGASGQCHIPVSRSGPFTLRAENPHGSAEVETQPVIAIDPPTIRRVEVPHIPADFAAVPNLSPLRALTLSPLPDSIAHPADAAVPPVDRTAGLSELLAALSADARRVVDRAVVASAVAVDTARNSVATGRGPDARTPQGGEADHEHSR